MENHKRAFRRWKKYVKFVKRIQIWIQGTYVYNPGLREEWKREILEGKTHTFLRTTSSPCNCEMCTCEKYERPLKNELKKQIWQDYQDDSV